MICPNCGHDTTGDDDEFVSGGGLIADHSITENGFGLVQVTEFRCPVCRHVIDREEEQNERIDR